MSGPTFTSPDGWGDDELSRFQSVAINREFEIFAAMPEWQTAISDCASGLLRASERLMLDLLGADQLARLLFIASSNQLLAAARSATSGNCLAAYPTGRAAVEGFLVARYLALTPDAGERWHAKPADPEAREAIRAWNNEFGFAPLLRSASREEPNLLVWGKFLYQTAIDSGAHPNPLALFSNMSRRTSETGNEVVTMHFIHGKDGLLVQTLKFVYECALFGLQMLLAGFPLIATDLRVGDGLLQLKRRLSELIETERAFIETWQAAE